MTMDRIEREILLNRLRHNLSLEDFEKLDLKFLKPLKEEIEVAIKREVAKANGKYVDLKELINFEK